MKGLSSGYRIFAWGMLAATMLLSDVAFCERPQNQQQCDQAGGIWVKNQLTGEFRCELPPSGPNGGGGNAPPPLPANLSAILLWHGVQPDRHISIRTGVGSNIGPQVAVDVSNDGTRAAPAGSRLTLALFGQDPPVLRFTLKTITLPQIGGGQTLREANFGVVRIGSNVPQGTYNLCAQLTTLKIDCVPLQVELTAAPGNHNN